MKMRKIIAAFTSAVMMTAAFVPGASAERVKFSSPEVTSDGSVTTVTYTLTEMPEGKSAALIAAYVDPESGSILSVNSQSCADVSQLDGGTMTITLADKSSEGGVLKHYLWQDLNKVISLGDVAPGTVTGTSAAADASKPYSKINVSWNAPADDWDSAEDLRYNVYDMGLLLAEDVSDTAYTAQNLKWGSKYGFEIEAVDSSGNVTARSAAAEAETVIPYTINTTDTVAATDSNVTFTSIPWEKAPEVTTCDTCARTYFMYTNEVVDNLDCVATCERKEVGTYHSVQVSEAMAKKLTAGTKVVLELEYWNNAERPLVVEFYSTNDGNDNKTLTMKSDGKWNVLTGVMELKYDIDPAGKKGHAFSHFRFRGGSKVADSLIPFYIRRMTFMTLDEYNALNSTRDAYVDVQAGIIHNGLTIDSPEINEVDGSYGVMANNLTVSTESEVTASAATGIEVIYYAPEGVESFTINGEAVPVTQSGCWQKAQVTLDGGLSGNSILIDGGVYVSNVKLINGLPALS